MANLSNAIKALDSISGVKVKSSLLGNSAENIVDESLLSLLGKTLTKELDSNITGKSKITYKNVRVIEGRESPDLVISMTVTGKTDKPLKLKIPRTELVKNLDYKSLNPFLTKLSDAAKKNGIKLDISSAGLKRRSSYALYYSEKKKEADIAVELVMDVSPIR